MGFFANKLVSSCQLGGFDAIYHFPPLGGRAYVVLIPLPFVSGLSGLSFFKIYFEFSWTCGSVEIDILLPSLTCFSLSKCLFCLYVK